MYSCIQQLTREEEIYRQDMLLLENDLYELEATVERLRGQAANRYICIIKIIHFNG